MQERGQHRARSDLQEERERLLPDLRSDPLVRLQGDRPQTARSGHARDFLRYAASRRKVVRRLRFKPASPWSQQSEQEASSDWEDWSLAPKGFDAATLYAYSLLQPAPAARVRDAFPILGSPAGLAAEATVCTQLLQTMARGDNLTRTVFLNGVWAVPSAAAQFLCPGTELVFDLSPLMARREDGGLNSDRLRADPAPASLHWPDDVLEQFLFDHGDNAACVYDHGSIDLREVTGRWRRSRPRTSGGA